MPRKRIEFTEEQNIRIAQLVNDGKNYDEITETICDEFGEISRSTIVKQVKELGLQIKDSRKDNKVQHIINAVEFDSIHKEFIRLCYEAGDSVSDIEKSIKSEFDITIPRSAIYRLIQKEGFVKGEKIRFDWEETDFGDEEHYQTKVKANEEKKSQIVFPEEVLYKIVNDENLNRLNCYNRGDVYNYCGQEGTDRGNMKDTWFTRDGFLKINPSPIMYFGKDYLQYETNGGMYRDKVDFESDMRFYTFSDGVDNRGGAAVEKRNEIKNWYDTHKSIINNLFDAIVSKNYIECDEVKMFNGLCQKLYQKKMEFRATLYGEHSRNMMVATGVSEDVSFNDIVKYIDGTSK